MKSFKKVMAGMLMGIMVIGMLTGCGGDPVADDFEKFLNTDMVDVNAVCKMGRLRDKRRDQRQHQQWNHAKH